MKPIPLFARPNFNFFKLPPSVFTLSSRTLPGSKPGVARPKTRRYVGKKRKFRRSPGPGSWATRFVDFETQHKFLQQPVCKNIFRPRASGRNFDIFSESFGVRNFDQLGIHGAENSTKNVIRSSFSLFCFVFVRPRAW